MKNLKCILLVLILFATISMNAQEQEQEQKRFAVKTNILHWATLTPNLGIEAAITDNISLEVSGGYNPFEFRDGGKWKHWIVWPEARYWLDKTFNGHAIGLYGVFADFDVFGLNIPYGKLKYLDYLEFKGDLKGAGISYTYALELEPSFLLEFNGGIGYGHFTYDVFREDGSRGGAGEKHYIVPTKLAVSAVYLF
jgi:hypothetical protein